LEVARRETELQLENARRMTEEVRLKANEAELKLQENKGTGMMPMMMMPAPMRGGGYMMYPGFGEASK